VAFLLSVVERPNDDARLLLCNFAATGDRHALEREEEEEEEEEERKTARERGEKKGRQRPKK
jgi:hypothetical protein